MSPTRRRWSVVAALAAAVLALTACGSSGSSNAAATGPATSAAGVVGSPGNWTATQKATFEALGSFGSATFTTCIQSGMEARMNYDDATKAFNAIPSDPNLTQAQLNAAITGATNATVANQFTAIATRCYKAESGTPASTPAVAAPATSQPAASTPAAAVPTTSTPSATATQPATSSPPLPGWTTAQLNQFNAAYDKDSANLGNTTLACIMAALPNKISPEEALRYVSVAWVNPPPLLVQIRATLIAKYGQIGATTFADWAATGANDCQDS